MEEQHNMQQMQNMMDMLMTLREQNEQLLAERNLPLHRHRSESRHYMPLSHSTVRRPPAGARSQSTGALSGGASGEISSGNASGNARGDSGIKSMEMPFDKGLPVNTSEGGGGGSGARAESTDVKSGPHQLPRSPFVSPQSLSLSVEICDLERMDEEF